VGFVVVRKEMGVVEEGNGECRKILVRGVGKRREKECRWELKEDKGGWRVENRREWKR
jgi:hypothetical protein